MKLNPQDVTAVFINDDEEYTVKYLMGAVTLIHGDKGKKKAKGVAFGDTNMAREVANNIIKFANFVDEYEAKKKKGK